MCISLNTTATKEYMVLIYTRGPMSRENKA
jgi:hypothetical protein